MQQQGSKNIMVEPATWPLAMQKVNLHLILTVEIPNKFLRMLLRFFFLLGTSENQEPHCAKGN